MSTLLFEGLRIEKPRLAVRESFLEIMWELRYTGRALKEIPTSNGNESGGGVTGDETQCRQTASAHAAQLSRK